MSEFLQLHELDGAIDRIVRSATKKCAFLLPTRTLEFIDLRHIRRLSCQHPKLTFHFVLSSRPSEPGIEHFDLRELTRMANIEIHAVDGEYDAIIANEASSVLLPGTPGISNNGGGYLSKLGITEFKEFKGITRRSQLLFKRTPVFKKRILGLLRRYIGSETTRNQLCFRP